MNALVQSLPHHRVLAVVEIRYRLLKVSNTTMNQLG
jgi:hypothetical protein